MSKKISHRLTDEEKRNLNFGSNLKRILEMRKISQKQLADDLGLHYQSVIGYTANRNEPSIGVLYRMCKYLDVSADVLLGLKELEYERMF